VAADHLADDRVELLRDLVPQEASRDKVREERAGNGLDVVGEAGARAFGRERGGRVELLHRAAHLRRPDRRRRRQRHQALGLEAHRHWPEAGDAVLQDREAVAVAGDDAAVGEVRDERVHALEVREHLPRDRRGDRHRERRVDHERAPGLAQVDLDARRGRIGCAGHRRGGEGGEGERRTPRRTLRSHPAFAGGERVGREHLVSRHRVGQGGVGDNAGTARSPCRANSIVPCFHPRRS
jgi:hypothetical protein